MMKNFLIALQFLTVLPVKIKYIEDRDFGKSLIYFPVVGALIGGVGALSFAISSMVFPHGIAVLLALIVLTVVTGGIHLDGLADTADGLYAGRDKDEILRIMRDSNVGTIGVIVLICVMLLKVMLLASISPVLLWRVLITAAILGRWAQVFACWRADSAREESKAALFIKFATDRNFSLSTLFAFSLSVILIGIKVLIPIILLSVFILCAVRHLKRRIGGMTGDAIGAVNEIAEAGVLLWAVI